MLLVHQNKGKENRYQNFFSLYLSVHWRDLINQIKKFCHIHFKDKSGRVAGNSINYITMHEMCLKPTSDVNNTITNIVWLWYEPSLTPILLQNLKTKTLPPISLHIFGVILLSLPSTPRKSPFSEGGGWEDILVIFNDYNNCHSLNKRLRLLFVPPNILFSEGKGWSFKICTTPLS